MMNEISILPSNHTKHNERQNAKSKPSVPPHDSYAPPQTMGPDPTLLSRKEVDALYEMLAFIVDIF